MDYTDTEKEFMEMILKIGAEIMKAQNNWLEFKSGYFDGNHFYALRSKLGLEDLDIW